MQTGIAKVNERTGKILFWLSWLVYFSSYLGRLNYSSAMSSILGDGILTRSQAGAISMAYFFAYGAGQLCNGILGDRSRPEKLVFFGLFGAGIANCLMGCMKNFPSMFILWGINGYLQSMIWPPIIRIFAERYTRERKMKYIVDLASSMAIGTLTSYLLSAGAMRVLGWHAVFFAAAGVMLPLAFVWIFGFQWIDRKSQKHANGDLQATDLPSRAEGLFREAGNEASAEKGSSKETDTGSSGQNGKEKISFGRLLGASGIWMILFPVWIHGMLKDGVTQWVPTYICDSYAVSASFSVIITMILPVINLSGAYLARFAQKKRPDREMENSAVFFAVATAALSGLLLLNGVSAVLSVLLFAVITSCMLAVNTLYVSMIPMHFEAVGRVSTVSGFLNAMAYIGSAVSTFTIGVVVERAGWNGAILGWILLTAAALAVAFLFRKKQFLQIDL